MDVTAPPHDGSPEAPAPVRQTPRPNRGFFSSEEEAFQVVVSRLVEALQPFRIYLFGSRAEGRARPDSDFDLLVVFDDDAPNSDADYDAVYAPLLGMGIGCDVIPCRWSEFQEVMADRTNPWQRAWASAQRVYELAEQADRSLPSARRRRPARTVAPRPGDSAPRPPAAGSVPGEAGC